MSGTFYRKNIENMPQIFSMKAGLLLKSRFFRIAMPILGGVLIGLLTALIMKFMGKHISF